MAQGRAYHIHTWGIIRPSLTAEPVAGHPEVSLRQKSGLLDGRPVIHADDSAFDPRAAKLAVITELVSQFPVKAGDPHYCNCNR
jgi:hypothetical protein